MKFTKIKIKNLFGIKQFSSNGEDLELTGEKGTGKTSVIDAIKYCLKNSSEREYIVKQGEDEGEVLIETDTGLTMHRKARAGRSDYKKISYGGNIMTEGMLRDIFTELQLNPIEFMSMPKKEQNAIVLSLIDFDWDHNWIIKKFGELVPEVDYDQNILNVLNQIQSDEGYYYRNRHEVNVTIRTKKGVVEEIFGTLPTDYNVASWEKFDLGGIYKEIETIRTNNQQIEKAKSIVDNYENKIRGIESNFEIEKNSIEKATSVTRNANEAEIAKIQARIDELKKENKGLEEKKESDIKVAKSNAEALKAEHSAGVEDCRKISEDKIIDFSEMQKEAENAENMKQFINEYNRMVNCQEDIETLTEKSQAFTEKIELARNLPAYILENSNIPVEGLSVKDGIPLINGLPISNLSEGEKLELSIDIAIQNTESLNILLLDGVERLSENKANDLYKKLKEKGVKFISTRTTNDSEMNVAVL